MKEIPAVFGSGPWAFLVLSAFADILVVFIGSEGGGGLGIPVLFQVTLQGIHLFMGTSTASSKGFTRFLRKLQKLLRRF